VDGCDPPTTGLGSDEREKVDDAQDAHVLARDARAEASRVDAATRARWRSQVCFPLVAMCRRCRKLPGCRDENPRATLGKVMHLAWARRPGDVEVLVGFTGVEVSRGASCWSLVIARHDGIGRELTIDLFNVLCIPHDCIDELGIKTQGSLLGEARPGLTP